MQIRRSNHGLGSFANSTQLILWNYWELRMSGGGYAMHRLLVLRFILRSGNLEALLHHSDICVNLSRHMFVYACICVVTGNFFSKLSFQTIFSSYFEKCCFGQFFLEIVILDKYFFTNCFCRSRQFFFSKIMQICWFGSLWSGGQGGGQRIEIDQSGQNSQVVWVAEVVRLVGVIRMVVVGMVGMVVRWSGWLGWSAWMKCIQDINGFHGLNPEIIEKSWYVMPVTD